MVINKVRSDSEKEKRKKKKLGSTWLISIWLNAEQNDPPPSPTPTPADLNLRTSCTYLAVFIREFFLVCVALVMPFLALVDRVLREPVSLLVRAWDSWSKGCEFESRQERQVNFLPQCQRCVLTVFRCPFHPRGTAVARKRPRSFFSKSAGGRWHLTRTRLWPNEVGVGWLPRCPDIDWKPIRKRAHTQLVWKHSATVVTVDWLGAVRVELVCTSSSTLFKRKRKKAKGRE